MSRHLRLVGWCFAFGTLALPLRAEPVPDTAAAKPAVRPWTKSQMVLPTTANPSKPVREVKSQGYTVRLDLSPQVLFIDVPKEQSWRSPGEFRPGDVVAVTADSARVMAGKALVSRLAKGRLLAVAEVKGEWLRTSVAVGDQPRRGWIRAQDVKLDAEEPALHPTLSGLTNSPFVPAAVLAQKAKQFDDGLYAAVELAAEKGLGKFDGKQALLTALLGRMAGKVSDNGSTEDQPLLTLLAARRLGEVPFQEPSSLEGAVARHVREFRANELSSKPLGFYTWSKQLSAIFQQDRMLQSKLQGDAPIEALVRSLHDDARTRATYESYLDLISRLTNPLSKPDLRPALASLDGEVYAPPGADTRFFPPSTSRENELVERLFADTPIPDGFNLADELVARIRSGEIDLTPRPNSGWYDYQTWALEPMALPERMTEAKHLQLGDEYRKQLLELFKGVLALTRETHVKQLEIPLPAAEAAGPTKERVKIAIAPELCAEPLASFYFRRAVAYRFVRQVLADTFGAEALSELHRLTTEGPVERNLAEELDEMEALNHGAYVAVSWQLGMTPDYTVPAGVKLGEVPQRDDAADAARFLDWAANPDHDLDLSRDGRMMVPIFYDRLRKKTKVWVFLGWASQGGFVSFATPPAAEILDESDNPVGDDGPELVYHAAYQTFVYPVMAEVYVDRLLDRDEFRRHCDTHQSRAVILQNLALPGS